MTIPMRITTALFRSTSARLLLALCLLAAGCGKDAASPVSDAKPQPPSPAATTPAAASSLQPREKWEIFLANGNRIGYGHTAVKREQRDGRELLRIEATHQLKLRRLGSLIEQELSFNSLETADGGLVEFTATLVQGPTPVKVSGRVIGDRLELQTVTAGKTASSSIPWSNEYAGLYGPDASLLRQPMQPGQRRAIKSLVMPVFAVGTVELAAKDFERVELRGGVYELLRIDSTTRLPGAMSINSTVWCDRSGEVLKTRVDAMGMESRICSKAEALAKYEPGSFDLGWDIAVGLSKPLVNAHQTERVCYRVTLPDRDPAGVFCVGPTQAVKPIDAHTAEITVFAIRPGRNDGNAAAPADPPTDEDRQPSSFIQSDDPLVVAAANEAAGDETDPWKTAVRLEQYVRRNMNKQPSTAAFATAAEVAKNPAGDCTEYAVYLAALARARGIPARTAMGLVYMEADRAFGYHMWTEVFIDGRWIPLDGTLGRGGIGAGHLKLGHSNLSSPAALVSMLPVVQIAGKLKIEVE